MEKLVGKGKKREGFVFSNSAQEHGLWAHEISNFLPNPERQIVY